MSFGPFFLPFSKNQSMIDTNFIMIMTIVADRPTNKKKVFIMSATNAKRSIYIEGKDLPPHILTRMNATPENLIQMIPRDEEVDYDDEGNPMPPESAISPEFIKMVEESDEDIRQGRYKDFDNVDDLFEDLDKQ